MAEQQRGQDELGGHVGGGTNASRQPPPATPPPEGSGRVEGRDQPPTEAVEEKKRSPTDPWMGGG